MRPALVVQTALLLLLAQLLLGLVGFFARHLPWAGLPVTVLFIWMLVRTANVVRAELPRRAAVRGQTKPFPVGLFGIGLIWQLPTLLAVPYWMPLWTTQVWQGALLPATGTIGIWWPGAGSGSIPWLWLAVFPEIALFVWIAGRAEPALRRIAQVAASRETAPESGEWAPAKRYRPGVGRRRPDLYDSGTDHTGGSSDDPDPK